MYLIRLLKRPNFFIFVLLNSHFFHTPVVHGRGRRVRRSQPKPSSNTSDICLGFIFRQHSAHTQNVFQKMVNIKSDLFMQVYEDVHLLINVINTADVYKLTRIINNQLSRTVMSMVGHVPLESLTIFDSYANKYTVPFMTVSTSLYLPASERSAFTLSVKPDYHEAIIDVVKYYDWPGIIYVYDSLEGLKRLETILHSKLEKKARFAIDYAFRVYNVNDVIQHLIKIEDYNQWSNKYVVLDCSAELVKETLIVHANEVKLGKRNYHYLLPGLVLDNIENSTIIEYGAINVTGFAVLDKNNKKVQEVLNVMEKNSVSAEAALLYDAFSVLVIAIQRLKTKIPNFLNSRKRRSVDDSSKIVHCDEQTFILPFVHGEMLSRSMKQTELEGLTGFVGFTDEGIRRNYSLQVMEMNYTGNLEKMGTWQEGKGLMLLNGRTSLETKFGKFDRSKKYIITTIIEHPFLVKEKKNDNPEAERLFGFCYDLASLLMDKLEVKFEMRVVKDGNYGNRNEKSMGGWDGMIGEILRQEADMAVASLIQKPGRAAVVDFSQPFLSFTIQANSTFIDTIASFQIIMTFLHPFTTELWIMLTISILIVSLCRCTISSTLDKQFNRVEVRASRSARRNRRRRRGSTPSLSPTDSVEQNVGYNETPRTLLRRFGNHLWDTIRTFLQQGSGERPRTVAEKISLGFWLFFTLLIFCFYTASLSSYLTINRIDESVLTAIRIFTCPQDNYRDPIDGSIIPWTLNNVFNHERTCELMLSSSLGGTEHMGIVLPKGSQLREVIDHVLDYLKREGEVERLIRKWFLHSKITSQIQYTVKSFSLEEASGIFFILFISLILAAFFAMVSYFSYKKKITKVKRGKSVSIELEQVVTGRIDASPTSHEVEIGEEQDDLERIEVYGVPARPHKRPHKAFVDLDYQLPGDSFKTLFQRFNKDFSTYSGHYYFTFIASKFILDHYPQTDSPKPIIDLNPKSVIRNLNSFPHFITDWITDCLLAHFIDNLGVIRDPKSEDFGLRMFRPKVNYLVAKIPLRDYSPVVYNGGDTEHDL